MTEKPRLVLSVRGKGGPMRYCCLVCGQVFPDRDDQAPKAAAALLMVAFVEHVREKHFEDPSD